MPKTSALPAAVGAPSPDDYVLFVSGGVTRKAKIRSILGAISALSENDPAVADGQILWSRGSSVGRLPVADFRAYVDHVRSRVGVFKSGWDRWTGSSATSNATFYHANTTNGTTSAIAATSTKPPGVRYTTNAGALSQSSIALHTQMFNRGLYAYISTTFQLGSVADVRFLIGFWNTLGTGSTPADGQQQVAMRLDTRLSPNWFLMVADGDTPNTVTLFDTGIVADTNVHRIGLSWIPGTGIRGYYDGALAGHVSPGVANLPGTGTATLGLALMNIAAVAKTFDIFEVRQVLEK